MVGPLRLIRLALLLQATLVAAEIECFRFGGLARSGLVDVGTIHDRHGIKAGNRTGPRHVEAPKPPARRHVASQDWLGAPASLRENRMP